MTRALQISPASGRPGTRPAQPTWTIAAAAGPAWRAARPGFVTSLSSRRGHHGIVRVLVVEDQNVLADRIAEGLRDAGMAVDVAYDGAAAMEITAFTSYDVIVLDRDLPRVHGDAVCASLVANSAARARILMLTAAAAIEDRVDGLNLGADDYLGKPFAFAELVARVRSLARRSPSAPPVVFRGDLAIDRVRRRVSRAGRPVALTRKEFGVLEELAAADGGVVSAEDLLERVWDEHADPFSNTVSVTVSRLRRKLGSPPPIETVIGCGYRLRDPR
jgi:DNA-binding response OmpR family regulator